VHLERYPEPENENIDENLSFKMNVARKVVGLGRSVRSKVNIKIRQPLQNAFVFTGNDKEKIDAIRHFEDIIAEELNVKKISFVENIEDLVSYNIKPNLKLLGSKYGALVPEIKTALLDENPVQIALKVKNNKNIVLRCCNKKIELFPEEILVEATDKEGMSVESDSEITVGLEMAISRELMDEGFCRELIHYIQNIRKEADFEIENLIETHINCSEKNKKIIMDNIDFIKKETLSSGLDFELKKSGIFARDIVIDGEEINIGIKVIK
jgi:isoleucyl-tRNA synthetase